MENEEQQAHFSKKFFGNVEDQRNSALTQAAELAAVLEMEREQFDSLTKELEAARAEIERLEQQVAQNTPRSSSSGNGKEAPVED